MAATALIQFTQGAHTDVPGKAVLGGFGDFSAVTVTNGDNSGVASWKILLLDAPSDSIAFPAAFQPQVVAEAADDTPTFDFTPDVAGTYRLMLELVDVDGIVDRDIRCFGIPDARGFVRPPYQQSPEPLPVELPAVITVEPRPIKPDEQNYSDNVRGWAGNGNARQLDAFLREHADLPFQTVDVTPFSAGEKDPPLHLVDVTTIGAPAIFNLPLSPRVGFVSRVAVQGTGFSVTIVPQGIDSTIAGGADVQVTEAGITLVHLGTNQWAVLSAPGGGGEIPPGSYVGQPAAWNGESWAPASALQVDYVTSRSNIGQFFANIDESEVWRSTLFLGGYAQLQSYGSVNINVVDGAEYAQAGPYHSFGSKFEGDIIEILRLGLEGDIPTIGFLGPQPPVPRQSITGETTQGQVNSLVAALSALGLVTDDAEDLVPTESVTGSFVGGTVTLTPLLAGHSPGLYLVSAVAVVIEPGTGKSITRTVEWTSPGLVGSDGTSTSPVAVIGAGSLFTTPVTVPSDGSGDISVSFSMSGSGDATDITLYAGASLQNVL